MVSRRHSSYIEAAFMTNRRIWFILGALAAVALCFAFLPGRKPAGNKTAADELPRTKWNTDLGVYASAPALGQDGTIYAAASEALHSVSPAGTVNWSVRVPGLRAAPAVGPDGNVYVGTEYGALMSFTPLGEKLWTSTWTIIGIDSPPAIASDGSLYVLNTYGDVFCFKPEQSSDPIWHADVEREGTYGRLPSPGVRGRVRSSVVLSPEGTLYAPRGRWLSAFTASGEHLWEKSLSGAALGNIALGADGAIYTTGTREDQHVYAVNPDGTDRWTLPIPRQISGGPVLDRHGNIYVTAGARLYSINPDGSLRWTLDNGENSIDGTPTLAADDTIYFGASSDGLVAVSTDAKIKWKSRVSYHRQRPMAIAPNGSMYIATDGGNVIALEGTAGLMPSAWPRWQHDNGNTGRKGTP